MNSTKLFKGKFFKENLKKSRELWLTLLLPILNIVMLVLFLNNGHYLVTFKEMSILSGLGMIIPVILAYILFGFLFKQKQVDFYLAKPISRKSLFFTNLCGGILLLIFVVLINTLIFGIFSVVTNITIPFNLLLDYFIYFSVTYIFIYVVSVMAVSLVGNLLSAFVVIGIVLLLFPFITFLKYSMANINNSEYYIYCDNEECKPTNYTCYDDECREHLKNNEYYMWVNKESNVSYTTPINTMRLNGYNSSSVVRTLILSLIYTIVGYFVFINRKMEVKKGYLDIPAVHFGLKLITFLPVMLLVYVAFLELDIVWKIISVLGAFAYFILYDLITRRKIYTLYINLFVFSAAFLIMLFGYNISAKMFEKDVVFKDIKELEIYTSGYEEYDNVLIKDKVLINKIIKLSISNNDNHINAINYTINYNGYKFSKTVFANEELKKDIDDYILKNNIKTRNDKFDLEHIDYVEIDKKYVKLDKKLKKLLNNNIDKNVSITKYSTSYDLHAYVNHEYVSIRLPIDVTVDLENYAIKFINNQFMNPKNKFEILYLYDANNEHNNEFSSISNKYRKEFMEYFKEHKDDNAQEQYLRIDAYYNNTFYNYYINDIESFNNFYQKYVDLCYNDDSCKELIL